MAGSRYSSAISPVISGLICTVLLQAGSALHAQDRAQWALIPDLRIGALDDPDYSFTRITGLAVDPRGDIYVADSRAGQIKIFDSAGKLLTSFGRTGAGPGEFRQITQIGWKGDTLWVSDWPQERVTLFDSRGRLLRTIRAAGPSFGHGRPTPPRVMLTDGSILGSPLARGRSVVPLLRMGEGGDSLNIPATIRLGEFEDVAATYQGQPIRVQFRAPFPTHTLWASSPHDTAIVLVNRPRAASATVAHFEVTKVTPAGDTLFARRYRYTPHATPPEVYDSLLAPARRILNRFVPAPVAESILAENLDMPAFQPGVTDLLVGSDGSIWLERMRAGSPSGSWLILDKDGHIRAEVRGPPGLDLHHVDSRYAWGTIEDEFEVPYVVRYRIARSQPGESDLPRKQGISRFRGSGRSSSCGSVCNQDRGRHL